MSNGAPMTQLSAIDLEILQNALVAAAAEMDVTMWRTSRSTIVREMLDYSTAIFDADGFNVAQSARIPQHLNSMSFCLRTIVERFIPLDRWQEGDVVLTNDPYCGGQHLPDIAAFRPVFVDGQRVAIVGTLCHHLDVGGMSAGSYSANATEIYQEGLRLPPLKLFKRGERNDEVWAMIGQNVRQPAIVLGDLQSQIASLDVGATSVGRLAVKYGPAVLLSACRRLLDNSEAAMRDVIARMPDGTYAFEDHLDDDGIDTERPVRLAATVTIKGSDLTVDLSGSSPEVRGPINATLGSTSSAINFAIMACADRPIAPNAGCYRPIKIVAPEGLIVNARHPAPVAHRIAPCHVLLNVLFGALAQAVPDRIPAAYYAVSYVCSFQTIAADASRRVLVEIEVGGCGGHPAMDGASGFSFGMHNNASIPIEMIESDTPLTIAGYGFLPDFRRRRSLSRRPRPEARVAHRRRARDLHRADGSLSLPPLRARRRRCRCGRAPNLDPRWQGDAAALEGWQHAACQRRHHPPRNLRRRRPRRSKTAATRCRSPRRRARLRRGSLRP